VDRGVALVATARRWLACSAALAAGFVTALQVSLWFLHSERTLASFAVALAVGIPVEAVLVLVLLRAEESRLARELRTARTGTATLRAMVAGRRAQMPLFGRLLSTKLGTAAVLLADGERAGALELLAASAGLMQGGRLTALRRIVEADAERAGGTPEKLDACIERLRALTSVDGRTGNRAADLYALHVLVKAILERGEEETAIALADELRRSTPGGDPDEEERVYAVWLEAWFDLERDPAEAPSDGEIRLAALLARAHGAEKLVEKLEERVAAIAQPEARE
jgi:hypothetical protein